MSLPTDAKARKNVPLFRGLLRYFPDALCAVAELSRIGNEQHNPGEPLHWAKEKSTDEADALMRHLIDAGTVDTDGVRHSTKVAWRALAQLQRELEAVVREQALLGAVKSYVLPPPFKPDWLPPQELPRIFALNWFGIRVPMHLGCVAALRKHDGTACEKCREWDAVRGLGFWADGVKEWRL